MAIETIHVQNLLNDYGEKIVAALKKILPKESDASGSLRQSINFTIKPQGLTYKLQLNIADYYQWVDKGRRPGKMPPVKEIVKWTTARGGIFQKGKVSKGKKGRIKQISSQLRLSENAGWAIARSIAKKGTRGTNFISGTVPPWLEELKKEIPRALKQDVLIELKNLSKKTT